MAIYSILVVVGCFTMVDVEHRQEDKYTLKHPCLNKGHFNVHDFTKDIRNDNTNRIEIYCDFF